MRRRPLLQSLGAGAVAIAGCLGRGGADDEGSPRPGSEGNDGPGETATDGGIPRTVALDGVSDQDLEDAIGIATEVSVLEPGITADDTARIRVSLDNTTDRPRTVTYTHVECDLNMIEGRHERADAGLVLVPADQSWERTEPDCWVPDGRNLNCGIPAVDHDVTIDPDDAVDWTFGLWADPKNRTACMPSGPYRFARTLRAGDTEASFAFTLSVRPG